MHIKVLVTGGTLLQRSVNGKMHIANNIGEYIHRLNSTQVSFDVHTISLKNGADLDVRTVFDLKQAIESTDPSHSILIITGTDSVEELAFMLDLVIPPRQAVVITGAMKPTQVLGYDGWANLDQAITVLHYLEAHPQAVALGVLLVMNDNIHAVRYVTKKDSQLIGSFQSHPGPMGQIRSGCVQFYYTGLPEQPRYLNVDWSKLAALNVPVLYFTLGQPCPLALLSGIDGLVIAGMGTSSLSTHWIEALAPYTPKQPIVLCSRSVIGLNVDEAYYLGSVKKYTDQGFIIHGFEQYNAFQARIKLMLELSLVH